MNQTFYRSPEWRRVRDFVITRDNGCDLVSNADQMGPCMGMKIDMLLKFPQTGLSKDQVKTIVEALDALDA